MMARLIALSVSMVIMVSSMWGQKATITGTLKDSTTQEPLGSANISLLGTTLGASTTPEGEFSIPGVPPGNYALRVSLIGYAARELEVTLAANDTLRVRLALEPEHVEEEEIVITGTRTERHIADVPVRIEAIPQEEVEEKLMMTPSSVAMLLNESTGMRVQTTSATSSTANLRIQGLSGRYTQVLVDGIPSYGGLSAGFGLTQIPPLNLRQVEVIKGASSVLYGADAISGVVNFITKDPAPLPELSLIVNGTTQRGADLAGFFARQFEDVGLTVLGSRSTQSLYDVDGDGFGDVSEYERYALSPKLTFSPSEDVRIRTTVGILSEERRGGAVTASPAPAGESAPYRETLKSRRLDASSQMDWTVSATQAAGVKFAVMQLRRDALYGYSPFDATQEILFVDAQYSVGLGAHALLIGAAYAGEGFTDRTPGLGSERDYRYSAPGFFFQDEIALADAWALLVGGRADFHNQYGAFATPRVSAMFRPSPMFTVRLGGGRGFKSPTIFTEEAEESGFRAVRPLGQPRAEEATSASLDLNWRGIVGESGFSVNVALYLTNVSRALIADQDSLDDGVVLLRNAGGATFARGGECSAKLTFNEVKVSLGYTYLYATQDDGRSTAELPLNPRHSFGAVVTWESEAKGAKVGVENYWTGSQRLERDPFRERSPAYWITGVIGEKAWGQFRFFVNFENIFDTRQTRFEPIVVGSLTGSSIRTVPIFAPLEGRVINGGIKFIL